VNITFESLAKSTFIMAYTCMFLTKTSYCRETAVRRLQVDSPRLRHTSTLCRYIVRLSSRTDGSDTLRQQTIQLPSY